MRKVISILSVPVDVVTMEEAADRVVKMYGEPGLHIVATVNAEMVMHAKGDAELFGILKSADLVIPDGAGVLWAAEQQGQRFPERVTGIDLVTELLRRASRDRTPVYALGAAPGVAAKALANASDAFESGLVVAGVHSGFFDEEEEARIVADMEESGAKLVLVAMGVPKQEKWIASRLSTLNGAVAIGIGGCLDVMAGHVPRAPKWMQDNRLEWLYRLYKEPSRIGRMAALPRFVAAVKRAKHERID